MPRSHSSKSTAKSFNNRPPLITSPLSSVGSYHPPQQPTVVVQQQREQGFMASVRDGFAMGAGASIARNMVDRMFGSSPSPSITSSNQIQNPCQQQQTAFDTCIKERRTVEECQTALNTLNSCRDSK